MTYIILILLALWVSASGADLFIYKRKIRSIPIRVHVNGIRGKSSIVRYIAAILRCKGYKSLAKTTGTSPRIIDFSGEEILLKRAGQANISEQLHLMKYFLGLRPQAVIVECMAINPVYARWLEDKVMNSNVYIMTNVRLDHQDQLGSRLEDIALSLCQSLPSDSVVITGETSPSILEIINTQCHRRRTRLIAPCVGCDDTDNRIDISGFTHVPVLENIKVCIAFASLFNISRDDAIAAMASTNPDPGHLQLQSVSCNNAEVAWANLFAVNDRESFSEWVQLLVSVHKTYHPVIILNNRRDRSDRVPVFCSIIQELGIKSVVTFGDHEEQVSALIGADSRILRLGNSSQNPQLKGRLLLKAITEFFPHDRILLVGAVNIHSIQAEHLLEYLAEEIICDETDDGILIS